jgi:outer membrane biosynthesis protein TonB
VKIVMRKLVFIAAPFVLTCAALPLVLRAGQDSSSSSSQSQPPPQESSSQSQQSDKPKQSDQPQQPALEKPGTAAPEPDAPKKPAPAKKPEAKKPVEGVNSRTVEEIIARVNNEIITRSELDKARAAAEEDAKQECQGKCTPEQLKTDLEDREKNALRDLIDQSLLVQRGKDMGVNVEPEVIKRLDQIRQQNKIDSMEDLEKAVSAQGQN